MFFKRKFRPVVILIKFTDGKFLSTAERREAIYRFYGSNNVVEPVDLDERTYRVLWVNPNWNPKDAQVSAEYLNKSKQWEAGEVFYAYSYPE